LLTSQFYPNRLFYLKIISLKVIKQQQPGIKELFAIPPVTFTVVGNMKSSQSMAGLILAHHNNQQQVGCLIYQYLNQDGRF